MAAPGLRPEPTSFPWKGSRPPGSWGRVDGNGEDLARAYTNLTKNSGCIITLEGLCRYLSVFNANVSLKRPRISYSVTNVVEVDPDFRTTG